MKTERAIRDTYAAAHRQDHGPSRHLLVVDEGMAATLAKALSVLLDGAREGSTEEEKDDHAR